jgi:hypothetical protein
MLNARVHNVAAQHVKSQTEGNGTSQAGKHKISVAKFHYDMIYCY